MFSALCYRRTDKDIPNARLPRGFVRQPTLVRLEARKADGHLGDNAGHDRTQPFVQRKWCFTPHNANASCNDTPRFCLLSSVTGLR